MEQYIYFRKDPVRDAFIIAVRTMTEAEMYAALDKETDRIMADNSIDDEQKWRQKTALLVVVMREKAARKKKQKSEKHLEK